MRGWIIFIDCRAHTIHFVVFHWSPWSFFYYVFSFDPKTNTKKKKWYTNICIFKFVCFSLFNYISKFRFSFFLDFGTVLKVATCCHRKFIKPIGTHKKWSLIYQEFYADQMSTTFLTLTYGLHLSALVFLDEMVRKKNESALKLTINHFKIYYISNFHSFIHSFIWHCKKDHY